MKQIKNIDQFNNVFPFTMDGRVEWADMDMKIPGDDFVYNPEDLKTIEYKELDLNKNWSEFNLHHELTDKGMEKFSADWNALIKQS